jgi:hypothetical protein
MPSGIVISATYAASRQSGSWVGGRAVFVGVGCSVGVEDGSDVGVDVGVSCEVGDDVDMFVADGSGNVDTGVDVVGATEDVVAVASVGVADDNDGAPVAVLDGNRTSARLVCCGRSSS